jgi:phosphatidylserine/phosphatidylglycerophosphate/cardiolipin synthase-like enzyme
MSPPAPNRAELLVDGHRILPVLLADLAAARRAIHVSVFLFFHDPIGDRIGEALVAAAQRGVTVRVLLNIQKTRMGDPFSTGEKEMIKHDPKVDHDPTDVEPLCRRLREGGVRVVDSNIDYDRVISTHDKRLTSIAAQIRDTISIDDLHIDHRKVIVVDGQVGYCGGANIGAQYLFCSPFDPGQEAQAEGAALKALGHPEPWWKWHDSLTRFQGPVVRHLDGHFRDRWILDGGPEFPQDEGAVANPALPGRGRPVRHAEVLVNEPNDQPNPVRETYLRLIREAERSIFIENPYTYHPSIVDALVQARQRRPALRVDMILPARRWNDNEFAHDAQQYHYRRLLAAGVAVHEYRNHFNHLKIAVFDERFSIHGSTNLNYRSLEDDKDFEMVVLVDDEDLARTVLHDVRDVDLRHCHRFTRQEVERTLHGRLRIQLRDPRTLFLLSRRVL